MQVVKCSMHTKHCHAEHWHAGGEAFRVGPIPLAIHKVPTRVLATLEVLLISRLFPNQSSRAHTHIHT